MGPVKYVTGYRALSLPSVSTTRSSIIAKYDNAKEEYQRADSESRDHEYHPLQIFLMVAQCAGFVKPPCASARLGATTKKAAPPNGAAAFIN